MFINIYQDVKGSEYHIRDHVVKRFEYHDHDHVVKRFEYHDLMKCDRRGESYTLACIKIKYKYRD